MAKEYTVKFWANYACDIQIVAGSELEAEEKAYALWTEKLREMLPMAFTAGTDIFALIYPFAEVTGEKEIESETKLQEETK